mmetsp:Transcript_26484/g.43356  ORF Transcript_26484/g.43356 Transcript_26484/m.43356 type:complete len:217 (-) Transcript_26484:170-820(-)
MQHSVLIYMQNAVPIKDGDEQLSHAKPSRFSRFGKFYKRVLSENPLATKSATSAAFFIVADILSQLIFMAQTKDRPCCPVNLVRTIRMGLTGLCVHGPFLHLWYACFLDKMFPSRTFKVVLYKLLIDEIVYGPASIGAFFLVIGISEGRTMEYIRLKFVKDFWPTLLCEWAVWPVAQLVNFRFVPAHWRSLYMNVISFGWGIFLAHVANGQIRKHL